MLNSIKLVEKVREVNEDEIRVLSVELVEVSDYLKGHFTYEIVYLKDDKIEKEHMIGKDVSDALYRFQQVKIMKFNYKIAKRDEE